ncbi:MAG: carboxymuconolactone decarboxylase family protein [Burkholderiales bacterium]|nr:carboxymuconolactone decarboxylase family protein [Burkholderiales bacterium]
MSRISIPSAANTIEASKPLLAAVQQQLGVTPNLMKVVGHSAAALEGYLSLNGALAKGKLNVQLRERIALAVAQANSCDYCLSAHHYLGRHVAKISDEEMTAARSAQSQDPKTAAALRFASAIVEGRGMVSDTELAAVRAAGFDEAAVIEIVLNVSLNILTNYVNNVAHTDIDFPQVTAK